MKIICIGQNYREHIKELGRSFPSEPVFFMKPDTALLRNNEPFYIPEFSNEIHYETEVVVKINRVVKSIDEKFASRCYDSLSVGIDFTARDIQRICVEQGRPWEIAKAFDKAAPISNEFIDISELPPIDNINFHLKINGEVRQKGNTSDMIFGINKIISYVSQFVTLKIGDLIFTGTPVGVGKVEIGDHIEAFLEDRKMLDFEIK